MKIRKSMKLVIGPRYNPMTFEVEFEDEVRDGAGDAAITFVSNELRTRCIKELERDAVVALEKFHGAEAVRAAFANKEESHG